LLVLDDGPEKNNLLQYIADEKLEDRFFMIGYTTEVINYMAVADMLVHPSLTEASNSVVKEMGVLKKTVAVCSGVGDFDSYIIDGKNGFLLPATNTAPALKEVIKLCADNKQLLYEMGNNLREDVLKKFHLNSETFALYDQLIKN
jgi:glycosyltransferase involved in cell wall biosynthesis